MENRKIIISIIALIFLSISFLIYRAENMSEPKWWAVHFSQAKDASLNFTLENYTDRKDFEYKILENEKVLKSEKIEVSKGEKKEINPEINLGNDKIIIQVISGEEKREIYKNF